MASEPARVSDSGSALLGPPSLGLAHSSVGLSQLPVGRPTSMRRSLGHSHDADAANTATAEAACL
jgi:hypothetical protein